MGYFKRLARLALSRRGLSLVKQQPGRSLLRDFATDELGFPRTGGEHMWQEKIKKGDIIVQETFSFPFIGEVVDFDDTRITLKNAVRILWDGRHGEFVAGQVPGTAEIEKTYSPLTIPADFCGPFAPYPHGIPDAQ